MKTILYIKSNQFCDSDLSVSVAIIDFLENKIKVEKSNISDYDKGIITKWYYAVSSSFHSSLAKVNFTYGASIISLNDYNSKVFECQASIFPTSIDGTYIEFSFTTKSTSTLNESTKEDTLSCISWDEYFMSMALLTSLRSKDLNTKVGSVIVSSDNKILGAGYNGLPSSIDESLFPKSRDGELHETKYAYVVHSELNAIINTTVLDLSNARLYCTLFPCNECAKIIVQKKIKEVIYLSDKYHNESSYIASRKLFDAMNVITRKYYGNLTHIKQ